MEQPFEKAGGGSAAPPMEDRSQAYIGTPNGIVLCADRGSGLHLRGRFYHAYSTEPVLFENPDQLVFEMERFFDSIHFPHPATSIRIFSEEKKRAKGAGVSESRHQAGAEQAGCRQNMKREKIMKDQELLSKHGDMGSFIIRVQQRQNSSMQGRLTWIEKNKTVYFRSVWELIRLIDSAVEMNSPQEEEMPTWED